MARWTVSRQAAVIECERRPAFRSAQRLAVVDTLTTIRIMADEVRSTALLWPIISYDDVSHAALLEFTSPDVFPVGSFPSIGHQQ